MNLYAYVGQNPMSRVDPSGLKTDGAGISFGFAFMGANGTGDVQYVTDENGRKGIAATFCGGGITQAMGATISAVFASTNAQNIAHLAGRGGTAGFAVNSNTGFSFSSGMSYSESEAGEKACSYKVTGQQINVGGGLGLGSPLEFSAGSCKTFVYPL